MMNNDSTPITVDMIRPFLTERGTIEVEYAIQSLRVRVLTSENFDLREKLNSHTEKLPMHIQNQNEQIEEAHP